MHTYWYPYPVGHGERSMLSQGCFRSSRHQLISPLHTKAQTTAAYVANVKSGFTTPDQGFHLPKHARAPAVVATAVFRSERRQRGRGVTEADIKEEAAQQQQRNQLTLEEVLQIVEGGKTSIAAHSTASSQEYATTAALLLYNLGKQAERGVSAKLEERVCAALGVLTDELTSKQQTRHGKAAEDIQPELLLAQLDPKHFTLSVWAASKLQRGANASVQQLSSAAVEHALSTGILTRFEWINWAQLLYGVALSGLTCATHKGVQKLFSQAAAVLTKALNQQDQSHAPQDLSNIIYAAARAGAAGREWQEYVAAVARGHAAGIAMVATSPRLWSNMVWACSILGVYDAAFLSAAAAAILQQTEEATHQDASNTLISLASLGWYEPAVYDGLVHALLHDTSRATPQSMSNVLYACCLAQHVTTAVLTAADAAVVSKEQKHWGSQNVSNSLLACAVFALHVRDSSKQAPLRRLSHILFQTASQDNPKRYSVSELRQLGRAHHAAEEKGLPCLSAQSRVLVAVQQEAHCDTKQLVKRQPLPFQHAVNGAAAATGRYMMMLPSIRSGPVLVQQEVQHKQLGYSLAVFALSQDSYFRQPLGKLTGPARLRLNRLAEHIPVIVVVLEHEWLSLGGDKAAQVAHVDRLLQQAEAAIAAAGVPAKQHSGEGSASQSRAEPILVGLPPQEYYCPPEEDQPQPADELTGAAPPAIPAPGPPQLTPEEAQARLKALQQQQQAFFKGLPPAPASGLDGVKSPAQPLQQQRQQPFPLTPPQAPALKPPRRPGA